MLKKFQSSKFSGNTYGLYVFLELQHFTCMHVNIFMKIVYGIFQLETLE